MEDGESRVINSSVDIVSQGTSEMGFANHYEHDDQLQATDMRKAWCGL